MKIQLSDSFTYSKLIRFTLPTVAMMVFTSVYGVVDGFFVSNFTGKTAFAAVNLIWPFLMVLSAIGFMFGTGGSALVAKTLGEGKKDKANRLFSLFIYTALGLGVVLAVIGVAVMERVSVALGATPQMLQNCVTYGRIILMALPAYVLQLCFQSFFVAAEKPKLGLMSTVLSGCVNIILDAVLVPLYGISGAAAATAASQLAGGIFPLIYFFRPNASLLRLGRTKWNGKAMLRGCTNGVSELLSNVSMSLVGMLYNIQLMRYVGENGVAAYGVLMYVNFVFVSVFLGYSIGVAPIVSYHYGAQNAWELKNLLKKSIGVIGILALCMFLMAETLGAPLSKLFVGYDFELYTLTKNAFLIYSFCFLFCGFSIFGSGFFTALNNGAVSAIISFMRTLVFEVGAVLLLPLLFGVNGIWSAVVVADGMAMLMSVLFLFVKRKKYKYM